MFNSRSIIHSTREMNSNTLVCVAKTAIQKLLFGILDHPWYCLDQLPNDCFRKWKKLQRNQLLSDNQAKDAVFAYFRDKEKLSFSKGINKLIVRCAKSCQSRIYCKRKINLSFISLSLAPLWEIIYTPFPPSYSRRHFLCYLLLWTKLVIILE